MASINEDWSCNEVQTYSYEKINDYGAGNKKFGRESGAGGRPGKASRLPNRTKNQVNVEAIPGGFGFQEQAYPYG